MKTKKFFIGSIGSGDIWNKNKKKIEFLNKKYGIICEEMECVSIYKVSNLYDIPVISIKGISNNEVLEEKYESHVREKTSRVCDRSDKQN